MISITARIGGFRHLKRVESINFTLSAGTTLDEFMNTLCQDFGDEVRHPAVLVAVNGQAVREPERPDIFLQDGDVVSVVRAFTGG